MKISHSQSNKTITRISHLFFDKKKIIKNSSYYTKIYSPKQKKILSKKNSLTIKTIQPIKSQKHKTLYLERVFNNKKNSRNLKIKWPKITHAKWPFSIKRTEPKELKQNRLLSSKPNSKYHNFNTIKWLSKKYSDYIKEKSIYSLLPNNGKPLIPEYESEFNKRHRQMMEYLESFHELKERERFVNINPKYFYDNTTFKKILKLKEMFMEFDKKGNHKMIIKEIVNLFKQNNINVDINDIKELFFKNIKIRNKKEEAKNLLYLNFYQFINFALTREQDFRQFMRNVKKKNIIEENEKNFKVSKFNEGKKKNIYIPMNFNLIFDYLINKEKQRNSIEIVENAIKEMDKIIQKGNNDDDKNNSINEITPKKELNKQNEPLIKQFKTSKTIINKDKNLIDSRSYHKTNSMQDENLFSIKSINELNKNKSTKKISSKISNFLNKEKEEEKLRHINFAQLIKEFSSLFGIEDNESPKKEKIDEKYWLQNKGNLKSLPFNKYDNCYMKKNEELNNLSRPEKSYTETMKKQIKINSLKNINDNNFEKYHDLKLALNATKEQIKKKKDFNLIDEDIQMYDMVDIRDILYNENFQKVKKKLDLKENSGRLTNIKAIKNEFNKREDHYCFCNNIHNNTDNYRTLKNEQRSKNKKFIINKKPKYNFYWGKPQILNLDDCYINDKKLVTKYDYVPNEFLTVKTSNKI